MEGERAPRSADRRRAKGQAKSGSGSGSAIRAPTRLLSVTNMMENLRIGVCMTRATLTIVALRRFSLREIFVDLHSKEQSLTVRRA